MSTVDLEAKIPNNVGLRDNKRLLRALEKWQPAFLEWWKEMGPVGLQRERHLPPHGGWRGSGWLGALRLREDARLPLGHLPRRAGRRPQDPLRRSLGRVGVERCPGGAPQSTAASDRDAGRHRAGVGRAAAHARPHRTLAPRHAQPVPGERGGRPPPVGDGLPAPHALRRGRPRRGGGDAPAAQRGPGQPTHPRGVQRADRHVARLLLLHDLHRPRRQVPARVAGGERIRSTGAHHAVHADRGGVPHADRRERRRPHRPPLGGADGAGHRPEDRRCDSAARCCRSTSTSGRRAAWTCSAARTRPTPPSRSRRA